MPETKDTDFFKQLPCYSVLPSLTKSAVIKKVIKFSSLFSLTREKRAGESMNGKNLTFAFNLRSQYLLHSLKERLKILVLKSCCFKYHVSQHWLWHYFGQTKILNKSFLLLMPHSKSNESKHKLYHTKLWALQGCVSLSVGITQDLKIVECHFRTIQVGCNRCRNFYSTVQHSLHVLCQVSFLKFKQLWYISANVKDQKWELNIQFF